jgi:high-affinity iron transporter
VAFGAALTYTSTSLLQTGASQEAFGGTCSLVAVALVTVMIFWMRKTARHLKSDLDSRLDAALKVGGLAVALTAFAAVGREGLETALFFWSAVQAAGESTTPIVGFALGIATAVMLAWGLYRRSVKLNLARFFTWTGAALIVVAAGVLGYAVHDLQEGNVLGGLHNLAFDVTAQVPPSSWYGALLKGVFNFSPDTTWLQAVAYVVYVVPVLVAFFVIGRRSGKPRPTVAAGKAAASSEVKPPNVQVRAAAR